MKKLFCKTLAGCVALKPQAESAKVKGGHGVELSDSMRDEKRHSGDDVATSSDAEKNKSVTKLLKKICDHLQNGVQDEEEEKMKNEWRLAAAVLDRICAIVFTVIFVTAIVIFFIIFAHHP